MNFLRKIHERKVPPGLEVDILRWLPRVTLAGCLVLILMSVSARLMTAGTGAEALKQIKTVDIFAIACGITFLTGVFTLAIGAIIVHIMKGPAFAADSYPVSHSNRPARTVADD